MNKVILGLTGHIAAGKGTIAEYLQKRYSAVAFRFSDPLRETLDTYDIPASRENLQLLSTELRKNFGEDILAKAMAKRINSAQAPIVIIDGVRRLTDVENLRSLPHFYLVAITVSNELRYQRHVARNQGVGDHQMTMAEFTQRDHAETEIQIPDVIADADFTIDNSGDVATLHAEVEKILAHINANQN